MNIDEIEKRAKSATANDITVNRYDDENGDIKYQLQSDERPFHVIGYFVSPENKRAKFDAEFFAHAREDVLALVKRIRELESHTPVRRRKNTRAVKHLRLVR